MGGCQSSATTNGVGVRLAAATPDGPSVMSRASGLGLDRWLARLGTADVAARTAIGWLAGDAVRGVGTLVAISRAESVDASTIATLDALSRVVPKVVLVTTGDGSVAATGFEVVPWLGDDGFGPAFAAPVERVGATR